MKFRRLFKDVAVYGVGDIILKATAFFTLPIYTRLFTPEEYGTWNFIITLTGLLSGVLILGGDTAYARFFFEAKTIRERQMITSTWFGFLALWSGGIIFLSLPLTRMLSKWSFGTDQHGLLFTLALLAIPVTILNIMCGQVLRNQFRAGLFTRLNIISTLLIIGLSLFGVVVLNMGLAGVLAGALVGASIILPIRLWVVRTMLRPVFSAQMLRKLLVFGTPLVPMSLAYWIFASSDRLILGKLSTLDQLGLYVVANSLVSVLSLINGAIGQAWSPYAVRMYEEQPKMAPVFFGQVMTYILVGFGVLCVGITAFAQEALMLLTTPTFYSAAVVVGPLALGLMAYVSTQVTALSISLTKQTKYFAIFSWMAALLNLGLNILLVPKWGMIAAGWSTAASYIFLTVAYFITSQRLWPIVYEKQRALITIGLTLAFTTAVLLLPDMSLIVDLIIKSIYFMTYLGLLFTLRVLDQREWQVLSSLISKQKIAAASTTD